MTKKSVGAPPGRSPTAFLARRIVVSYPLALAAMATLVALAFGRSYWSLVSFAGSESPQSLVAILPLVGFSLLAVELSRLGRHGNEVGLNLVFAVPLLVAALVLVIWIPPRLSYFYWVYRLDLLAATIFLAALVVLFFGLPELLSTRLAFPVLLLGWPPLLDWVARLLATPLAKLSAYAAWPLATLLADVERRGTKFVFPRLDGFWLEVSSACSGLVGIFTMAALVGLIAYTARGTRRRKLFWFGCGLLLAFVLNVVRIVAILVVTDRVSIERASDLFHSLVGIVLFAIAMVVMLLSARRFGVELSFPPLQRARPLEFKTRGAISGGLVLLAVVIACGWATAGFQYREAGLFRGAPIVRSGLLLAPAGHYRVKYTYRLPFVASLFGKGTRASVVHYTLPSGRELSAQVVVTKSYRKAARYGALECFVFHRYKIYSMHRAALPDGGSVSLIAIRADGFELATASWLQPVTLGGKKAWRRVVLFEYLKGTSPVGEFHPSWSRRLGLWLLNTFAPYGGTHPPERFKAAERELTDAARMLATGGRR